MRNQSINILLFLLLMTTACNQQKNSSPEQWDEKKLNEWFDKGDWKKGWDIKPDESVNRKEFAIQYFKHSKRWEKAFSFLQNEDLAALAPGRYELEGSDLFVNVDEYVTKNEEDTRFEAHRKYADIQYLISGRENIGVISLSKMKETTVPYNTEKDIAFYSSTENNYRLADNSRFFIFFPDDAHRPCFKMQENEEVKKVVIKVALD